MSTPARAAAIPSHGDKQLPAVVIEAYNCELSDEEGYLGDRACRGAFVKLLEETRKAVTEVSGEDPLGEASTEEISKKQLDALLLKGDPEAAGVVQGAIEEFAQALSKIIARYLKLKTWRDTECIVAGGGLRASRVGELAIGRTAVLLKTEGIPVSVTPIHNHPDEAGLLGALQLAPPWIFAGHDAILAVDIGGSNIRAGIVTLNSKKSADLSKGRVHKFELWRHADEKRVSRGAAIEELVKMLEKLIERARKDDLALAPFIGIGCPGVITPDGTIERGAQNLPGNWEGEKFNLPDTVREAIPRIGQHPPAIILHNDAVVQGLSEVPYMRKSRRWGVVTIGTGLGNACFSNRD